MSRQILHSKLVELLEAPSPSWLEDDFGLLKSFSEPLEFELVAIFITWWMSKLSRSSLGIPCTKWPPCCEGFLVRNTVGYLKIEICFSFHKHNIDELFLLLGLARNKNSLRKSKITPCLTTIRFAYSKYKVFKVKDVKSLTSQNINAFEFVCGYCKTISMSISILFHDFCINNIVTNCVPYKSWLQIKWMYIQYRYDYFFFQIYSRTPLTRTLKGKEKLFELVGVRVNKGGVKFRLLG